MVKSTLPFVPFTHAKRVYPPASEFAESSQTARISAVVPGRISKESDIVDNSPGAVAISVYISAGSAICKSVKVATPSDTVIVLVPVNLALPGLSKISTVIEVVLSVETKLLFASRISTTG